MKKISILLLGFLCSCAVHKEKNFHSFKTCNGKVSWKTIEYLNTVDEGSSIEVITYHTAKWKNEPKGNGHYLRGISSNYTKSPIFYDSTGERVSGEILIYDCDYQNVLERFTLSDGVLDGVVFDDPQTMSSSFNFYEDGNFVARVSQTDKIVVINNYFYNGETTYVKERLDDDEQDIKDLFFSPLKKGEKATLKCFYYYRPNINQNKVDSLEISSDKQSDLTPLSCPNMITFKDYYKAVNPQINKKEEK